MKKQHPVFSLMTDDEIALLQNELLRRAANGFEETERWREAAECWEELGEQDRAGALYTREGASEQSAHSWLLAGHYLEAMEAYRTWEKQLLSGNMLDLLRALLGQAACHFLGSRAQLPAQALSESSGRQAYRQARELLTRITAQQSPIVARCWETLGEYGTLLGRYDLVQEGYEHALDTLNTQREEKERIRVCKAYLMQAQIHTDRLLCRYLEEFLVIWNIPEKQEKSLILPLPVATLHLLHTLTGHTNGVWKVAISPNGQKLVSAGADHTIKIWDLPNGREIHTLSGHENIVTDVAISPDGLTIVSASADRTIKIWDLATGEQRRTLTDHTNGVQSIAISPDGRTLVSASADRTIKIWDLPTGSERRTLTEHTNLVRSVKISSDGLLLVSASYDGTIRVWDLLTGRQVHMLTGHTNLIIGIAISPDGRTLVSASADRTMKIWDLPTGNERRMLTGHENTITDVAISPDGQTLVSVSHDRTIRLWDLPTGKEQRSLKGHTHGVQGVAISPDGQMLASAGRDRKILLWGTQ